MSPGLLGLAVVALAGGVVAVTARASQVAILGVLLVSVAAPLLASPLPEATSVAARLLAAVLAAYLLRIAVPAAVPTRGTMVGWQADLLVAGSAAVAGGAVAIGGAGSGPPEALLAGSALGTLAIGPLLAGRDALRVGVGMLLAVHAVWLIAVGLNGTPGALEQLSMAGLVVSLGVAVAALGSAAIRLTGTLQLVGMRSGIRERGADATRGAGATGGSRRASGIAPRSAGAPPVAREPGAHRVLQEPADERTTAE